MYEAYRAKLPSVQGYLRRIGVEAAGLPTAENLQKLIAAHVKAVPFENLTIVRDKAVPDLAVEALYRKIVEHRRGGWCFELNGLFYALLLALGYEARPIGARVMLRHPEEVGPVDHRASIVRVDGREYLADVGFGATLSFYPIPLDGEKTPDGLWVEREGAWLRLYRQETEKRLLLLLCDAPCHTVDFLPANHFMATAEGSHFRKNVIVNLRTETGRKSLTGCVFEETGKPPVTLREDEIPTLLQREFGME